MFHYNGAHHHDNAPVVPSEAVGRPTAPSPPSGAPLSWPDYDFLYVFPCDIYAVRRVNAMDLFYAQPSIAVLVSLPERFCQLLALLAIANSLLVEQHDGRHSDRGVHKAQEQLETRKRRREEEEEEERRTELSKGSPGSKRESLK